MGGAALAGARWASRSDRAHLPLRDPLCRKAVSSRVRHPQRGSRQPGAGVVWRCRDDAPGDRRHPAGGDVLGGRFGVAGEDGDADQRVVVGDDGRRRGAQLRSDHSRGAGSAGDRLTDNGAY